MNYMLTYFVRWGHTRQMLAINLLVQKEMNVRVNVDVER